MSSWRRSRRLRCLDESILNSRNPLFADWSRKPLQEEMFGIHIAGETFFQYAQQLLARPDSPEAADLLEVYYLCLLLGYCGRYSVGDRGELQAVKDAMAAKDPPHPRALSADSRRHGRCRRMRCARRAPIPG